MKKLSTILLLAFISQGLFAQSSTLPIVKLPVKNVLQNLSYIPAKSFNSFAYAGKDSVSTYAPRISSVPGFYISQAEVTNKEYREFVHYVRDSVAHTLLHHFRRGTNTINWNQKINWKDERLDPIMIDPDERIIGRKEIDPDKIFYRIDFFGQQEKITICPDTLVWIRDFAYSYNEPLVKRYFSHPAYDNYPVIGISLKQAMAYCQWKTAQISGQAAANTNVIVRLPSAAEWESAAIEEKDTLGLFSGKKQFSCNFGTITDGSGLMLKGYEDDGYFYTGPVKKFAHGPYGLYDMKGNVSEWTSTSRDEIMNMEVKPEERENSFIVKGGGWDSSPFYLQAGVCQFFPATTTHSFIGFRYVVYIVKK